MSDASTGYRLNAPLMSKEMAQRLGSWVVKVRRALVSLLTPSPVPTPYWRKWVESCTFSFSAIMSAFMATRRRMFERMSGLTVSPLALGVTCPRRRNPRT